MTINFFITAPGDRFGSPQILLPNKLMRLSVQYCNNPH
nr:MAG TPA_asm: hypothetical protein [Caudoviricetes sp.]